MTASAVASSLNRPEVALARAIAKGKVTVDFVAGVNVSTLAGSGASGRGDGSGASVGFSNPVSVAVAPNGNLFVVSLSNGSVYEIFRR